VVDRLAEALAFASRGAATYRHRVPVSRHRARRKCPICLQTKVLVNDHCHATGSSRENICITCNAGLGMFHDNPQHLRWAARYLEQWHAALKADESKRQKSA